MTFNNPKNSSYILTSSGSSIAKNDDNIGQQLLKKMGWQPDTGLGKDGSGIVDPIKASCNYGRKGLGKGIFESDSGMVQQLRLSEMLKSLSKHKTLPTSASKTKLEDKSKRSKSRVHYGKFVRAKDVSQYSAKSLKIVLGAPHSEPSVLSPSDNGVLTVSSCRDSAISHDFGIKTFSSTMDSNDYFAMKRLSKKTMDSRPDGASFVQLLPISDADTLTSVSSKNSIEDSGEIDSSRVSFQLNKSDDEDDFQDVPQKQKRKQMTKSTYRDQLVDREHDQKKDALTAASTLPASGRDMDEASSCFDTSNLPSLSGYPHY